MEITEFKIGEHFYTGSGKWLCVDVGELFVLAIKEENIDFEFSFNETHPSMEIFDHLEFGGCCKEDRFQD